MDKQYKKYLCILIATELLICAVVAIILIYLSNDISVHNNETLRMVAIKDAEDCMREEVDNIIIRIQQKREAAFKEVESMMDLAVTLSSDIKGDNAYNDVKTLSQKINRMEYGKPIQMILYVRKNDTAYVFLRGEAAAISNWRGSKKINEILESSSFHRSLIIGESKLYLFATQEDIDGVVKAYIYNEIHSFAFNENEYMWVNEILNYDGGDNYAIRVIHPNLKNTEGEYLSTNTQDLKGSFPYLDELEGIKREGEVVHTYYFKNRINDEITKKMSYAKIYRPYNWVIATGEPMNDIFAYTDKLKDYDAKVIKTTLIACLCFMMLIFLIGILIIIRVHRKYRKNIETYVKTETELDPLTGALSRKAGQLILEEHFQHFKDRADPSPLLMMLDVDDFKKINDTYGHDVGDIVIKKVSQVILANIRESDHLFRWGGEEFVLVCGNVDMHKRQWLGEKILSCVSSLSFESGEECFHVSVSIGGACFCQEDCDYMRALKRADVALYHSKNSGKNKYSSFEELSEE